MRRGQRKSSRIQWSLSLERGSLVERSSLVEKIHFRRTVLHLIMPSFSDNQSLSSRQSQVETLNQSVPRRVCQTCGGIRFWQGNYIDWRPSKLNRPAFPIRVPIRDRLLGRRPENFMHVAYSFKPTSFEAYSSNTSVILPRFPNLGQICITWWPYGLPVSWWI